MLSCKMMLSLNLLQWLLLMSNTDLVSIRIDINKKADGDLSAHQLTLTATPIPRTLSMSIYANMDVSVINELPPGRVPIQTSMVALVQEINLLKELRQQ